VEICCEEVEAASYLALHLIGLFEGGQYANCP
jgi:hypothetical protein